MSLFACLQLCANLLSCKQSPDECGGPAQAEPGLGTEVKVELCEWENGEMRLEQSRVQNLEKSP